MAGLASAPSSCLSSAASLQGSPIPQSRLCNVSSSNGDSKKGATIVAQKKAQKRFQIVLKEDVQFLGKTGQVLTVKPGYYRNYLYPYGKAQVATPEFLKQLRLEEERKEAEKLKIKEEAESDALMFKTIGVFNCRRKIGKGKQIFGSVTTQDLVDIIKSQTNRVFDKRDITLPEIREIGEYIAEIKLHPEVTAKVRLNVIPN